MEITFKRLKMSTVNLEPFPLDLDSDVDLSGTQWQLTIVEFDPERAELEDRLRARAPRYENPDGSFLVETTGMPRLEPLATWDLGTYPQDVVSDAFKAVSKALKQYEFRLTPAQVEALRRVAAEAEPLD